MSLKNFAGSLAVAAMAFASVANAQDTFTFTGGTAATALNDPLNWLGSDGVTTGLPGVGDIGLVNTDVTYFNSSNAGIFTATGDIIFGGGSTVTSSVDVTGNNPNSITFNDVTLNVGDDIFSGGNLIFNAGSVTNVDDDFEANSGGILTLNGGIHTLGIAPAGGSNFGAQNDSTLNFLGGTVTGVDLFRTTNEGAALNIGGDASISTLAIDLVGTTDFLSTWTGFIDNAEFSSLGEFQTLLVGSGATLDGLAIDADLFNSSFELNGAGALTLSSTAIPEPSSIALLGLAGLGLVIRRRK